MKKRGLGLCISALLLAACSNDEPDLPQNSEPDQVTESAPRPEPALQKLAIGSVCIVTDMIALQEEADHDSKVLGVLEKDTEFHVMEIEKDI